MIYTDSNNRFTVVNGNGWENMQAIKIMISCTQTNVQVQDRCPENQVSSSRV